MSRPVSLKNNVDFFCKMRYNVRIYINQMAELKNYDHADQVISPDDFKLSEAHTQERLDTQANIATARIKEVSVGLKIFLMNLKSILGGTN